MFRPTLANPGQKRTIRPLYAQHQATPYAGFLDPTWDKSFDIFPGTVMVRTIKEIFRPATGAAGENVFGLSAFFVAPRLGIDEIVSTGNSNFTVWTGGPDAVFEILAPAFDPEGDWSMAPGVRKFLKSNSVGKLTPAAAGDDTAQFELIDVIGADKILVRFRIH